MRPLPRLLALTTDALCRAPDFGIRTAAVASAGPAVGLVVRAPGSTAAQLAAFAERTAALCRPPEAALVVHARADLARALGAHGVLLRADDLAPGDARLVLESGWIGRSVHSVDEAGRAIEEGADFLVAGNVWETTTHPDRPARGTEWLQAVAALGTPVYAIGGVTPGRAALARRAGAWGVAAISAVWEAEDSGEAGLALVSPWLEEGT